MKRVAAKFVHRALTDYQKEHQVETCHGLKQQLQSDPNFLSKIITSDETWCYGYDPDSKHLSGTTSPSSLSDRPSIEIGGASGDNIEDPCSSGTFSAVAVLLTSSDVVFRASFSSLLWKISHFDVSKNFPTSSSSLPSITEIISSGSVEHAVAIVSETRPNCFDLGLTSSATFEDLSLISSEKTSAEPAGVISYDCTESFSLLVLELCRHSSDVYEVALVSEEATETSISDNMSDDFFIISDISVATGPLTLLIEDMVPAELFLDLLASITEFSSTLFSSSSDLLDFDIPSMEILSWTLLKLLMRSFMFWSTTSTMDSTSKSEA
ncbi:unnamed protein product [Acanthoscelides obtectus]|uniref:Uncharacterized protein n=1 Tax=Acanthoscelides obtectus TaxID=200917 RepID=A0A9P0L2J0_ACAOB|nr:unnamed protein product [Acanthoscelides obtectus]CAK1638355.1 hypothetical protein AOBTE_LOCUS10558 [Acanthoscelides obtectus]